MIENDTKTFSLSIEPMEGKSYQYGFHFGTIESVARQCAEDKFRALQEYTNGGIRTVALIRNRKLFDVFDGKWNSETDWMDEE